MSVAVVTLASSCSWNERPGGASPAGTVPAPGAGRSARSTTTLVEPAPGNARRTLGIAPGGLSAVTVRDFESYLGRPVYAVVDFLSTKSWAEARAVASSHMFGEPGGRPGWSSFRDPSSFLFVESVPLVTGTADPKTPAGARAAVSALRDVAAGENDADFAAIASTLVQGGFPEAVIRLGWEHTGDWFLWRADLDPEAWVQAWRRAVSAMRSVPNARFRFEWTLVNSREATAKDPSRWYPGDEWVDIIGMDVYDSWSGPAGVQRPSQDPRQRSWENPAAVWAEMQRQPYGLVWIRDFAKQRGKPMAFGEWSLSGGGTSFPTKAGNDDPFFIQAMYDWIDANPVVYHAYFSVDVKQDGPHKLGNFPRSAALFRELFGSG